MRSGTGRSSAAEERLVLGDEAECATWRQSRMVSRSSAGRQLELSLVEDGLTLAQPRLVTGGDVKCRRLCVGCGRLLCGSGPARTGSQASVRLDPDSLRLDARPCG